MKHYLSIFALLLVGSFSSQAFKLTPTDISISPTGSGANAMFQVENVADQKVAIQFQMLTRDMDENGQESRVPVEEEFIIYPPQVILDPGKRQTVRVRWVGEEIPQKEIAYRLMAEQLPINLTEDASSNVSLNLVVRILGSFYLTPKGARPEVVVQSAEPVVDAEGRRQVAVFVKNHGSAHGLLLNLNLRLTAYDSAGNQISQFELQKEQLKGMDGENVLQGKRRRFLIPWPDGLEMGQRLEASITKFDHLE